MAAPTATIVVADGALAAGETSLVTFTFSEAVLGFTNADLTVANGALSAVATSNGGVTWTATLTPGAGLTDATNVITLNNAGVTDAGAVAGAGTTVSNNYAVDTAPPTATIVVDNTDLHAGDTTTVTVTFSEHVTGFTNADLTVDHGALSTLTSNDGIIYTATFTPTASLAAASNLITLGAAGVADDAGNLGVGSTTSNTYAIDTTTLAINQPGTAGDDVIAGNTQSNLIDAGDGADSAAGGTGDDTILGGAGGDTLQGNVGSDSISGGLGADTILGGQGDDTLQGNEEGDYLSGDKGADLVFGGKGDDTVVGGTGDDTLSGDTGDDSLAGGTGDDMVLVGLGDDVANGGQGDDYIFGDKGADILRGGQGSDQVLGGDGDDWLSGDRGSDTITGGAGADTFHVSGDAGLDRITDFNQAEGDQLLLDAGSTYTAAQVGADTVISISGGAQAVLANVQLASLTPGWILAG